jgi:peptide subunit release factor 1 (eRF1)
MISTTDIQRLIQRQGNGRDILSLFLDMSVNSDNKRTHHIFLAKEKAAFAELNSDRDNHHRVPIGEAFARLEDWIDASFDATNKGLAMYTEVGGDWFEAFQFPLPVANRLHLLPQPVVAPLTELVSRHPRYAVIVVDREHLRLVAIRMGVVLEEVALAPEAIPAPHDVQAGGYSHKDFQKRKAEEARTFFRDFADEIARFDDRRRPDHYVLLGTTENTRHFLEFLPKSVADRIVHTAHAPPATSAAEYARHLQPVLDEVAERGEAEALDVLRERVREAHLAAAGVSDTLVQLQGGKVERLVLARGLEQQGAQCTQCGFYLVRSDGPCPYCGGTLEEGVDLVESMVRMAATQDVAVEFVPGDALRDVDGVGALLKF